MLHNEIISMLQNIRENNSGATLYACDPIRYDSGYQYAKTDIRYTDIEQAAEAIETAPGIIGVWWNGGAWVVEESYHEHDLALALAYGAYYEQQTLYSWADDSYIEVNTIE